MKQILIIPHRLPCINDMTGCVNKWVYSKLKKDTESSIEYEIKRQKLKPMPYAYLKFIWFEKDKRRNPDNVSGGGPKFVLDSLVRCGILKNDGWSEVLGIQHGFVVGDEASVHIELTDKPEPTPKPMPRLERCNDCLGQRVKGTVYHCES